MGLLNRFRKAEPAVRELVRLPSGSFTVDAAGKVIVSTLPRAFPEVKVREISMLVLRLLRSAREVDLPMSELVMQYSTLRLTARELRGGAIIFLAPRALEKR
jgi:hypothetical protein